MRSVLIAENKILMHFYNAYLNMLKVEHTGVMSFEKGFKLVAQNKGIVNIFAIVADKNELMSFNKLWDAVDINKQNVFIIFAEDGLMQMFNGRGAVVLSHKQIIDGFSSPLVSAGVCRPYNEKKTRSAEDIFEYVKGKLIKGEVTLPISSDVSLRILPMLNDEKVDFADVTKLAKLDPALYAGLVKMSNSIYFGAKFSEVKDLNQALVRLGTQNVKSFLISYINRSLAENKNLLFKDEIQKTVSETVYTSALCYVLAGHFKMNPDVVFSIGMMHKLGYIFMLSVLSKFLQEQNLENEHHPKGYIDLASNNQILATTTLMKRWKFPPQFYMPINDQNNPKKGSKYLNETRILFLSKHFSQFYLETDGKDFNSLRKKIKLDIPDNQLMHIKESADKHAESLQALLS